MTLDHDAYELLVLNQRIRAYQEAAEPLIRYYSNMMNYYMPQITIWPDGRTETVQPPEVAKLVASLGDALQQLQRSCGLMAVHQETGA